MYTSLSWAFFSFSSIKVSDLEGIFLYMNLTLITFSIMFHSMFGKLICSMLCAVNYTKHLGT